MHIHRVTYNPKTGSASLYFIGCNFRCRCCYWKQIYGAVDFSRLNLLDSAGVISVLRSVQPKSVTILSGDPRLSEEFRCLPATLRDAFGCAVRLLTNGFILPDLDGVTHVSMSIKAVDDRLHQEYTGRSNVVCLDNFRKIREAGIELSASSVFIPGLIDGGEIEAVSRFIAGVSADIPFRVIGYMRVDGMPYREPSPEEVEEVGGRARRHLSHVVCSRSSGEDYTGIVDLFTNNIRR